MKKSRFIQEFMQARDEANESWKEVADTRDDEASLEDLVKWGSHENDAKPYKETAEASRETGRETWEAIKRAAPSTEEAELDESGVFKVHEYGNVSITSEGDMFGTYKDLNTFLRDVEMKGPRDECMGEPVPTMEAHHLIHQAVLKEIGFASSEGPCVALWSSEHMGDIHSLISPPETTNVDGLRKFYDGVYGGLGVPEWGKEVDRFLEVHRERIEQTLDFHEKEAVEEAEQSTNPNPDTSPKETDAPE